MDFKQAAAAFRERIDQDKTVNYTTTWTEMVNRLEDGYYLDAETASTWRQMPAADVYASTFEESAGPRL